MSPLPEVATVRRAQARYWSGLFATLALAVVTPGTWAGEADAGLQPYRARYQVSFRGLSGGQIESSLSRGSVTGQWLYETRAYPSMLARVAVSPQAREHGVMQVTAAGVRPLTFDFNDGSEGAQKDVRFAFDWTAGRVRGEAQGAPFDLAVKPGTQDTASVQAAMIMDLLAGRQPQGFTILTGSKLRDYRYWPEGKATIVTPYGQFETVIWANQRSGSTRLTKVWHAPALGYVPIQAVQYRKGQAETQMKLVALTREQ
jgi:hypothetical protein